MTPPTHPGGQVDSEIKNMWVVLHVQGEGYQPPKTSRSGSSQELNLIKDKIPVLGLDIVERQV